MYPIIIVMVIIIVCHIINFPGGFISATKLWIKRKSSVRKNGTLNKKIKRDGMHSTS